MPEAERYGSDADRSGRENLAEFPDVQDTVDELRGSTAGCATSVTRCPTAPPIPDDDHRHGLE